MNYNAVVIMCPPYPEYKEAPADHSKSILSICPKCNGKMWLSSKKMSLIVINADLYRKIILRCYDCIKKMAEEEPEIFAIAEELRI